MSLLPSRRFGSNVAADPIEVGEGSEVAAMRLSLDPYQFQHLLSRINHQHLTHCLIQADGTIRTFDDPNALAGYVLEVDGQSTRVHVVLKADGTWSASAAVNVA